MAYARPASVSEALRLLAADEWLLLAGGTDVYPAEGDTPLRRPVLDLTGLADLRGIMRHPDGWRIGALTTWSDIARAELPQAFDALRQAAREVGSVQIQNRATIAGNLCNASPAADGVPALLVLDAEVELASPVGMRRLPLDRFILGSRSTARGAGEIVTAIRIPDPAAVGRSVFQKLGARRYLVISIVMVAVRLALDAAGRVAAAAVAVGACSPVARRLEALERALLGHAAAPGLEAVAGEAHLAGLAPIEDVRGSAAYRRAAALEIVRRGLRACVISP